MAVAGGSSWCSQAVAGARILVMNGSSRQAWCGGSSRPAAVAVAGLVRWQ